MSESGCPAGGRRVGGRRIGVRAESGALSLLSYGIRTALLGRRIPLLASFKITYRCNLRCAGCPFQIRPGCAAPAAGTGRPGLRTMPPGSAGRKGAALPDPQAAPADQIGWERALEALRALKALGCRFLIFEGGEPLLWRDGRHDFAALAEAARPLFLRVGATSNGTLPLDVPTDLLWVSLDGARSQHNLRRDGSFDRALSNIERSRHPRLLVHYTVNRENIADIPELARTLAGRRNVKGITFQFFYPYGQGELDLALSPGQRRKAVGAILALKRAGTVAVLNSAASLRRMVENTWTCRPWMLANVDPDGEVRLGCYLEGRAAVRCRDCGFTPVAEASLALSLHPGALRAGRRIFLAD